VKKSKGEAVSSASATRKNLQEEDIAALELQNKKLQAALDKSLTEAESARSRETASKQAFQSSQGEAAREAVRLMGLEASALRRAVDAERKARTAVEALEQSHEDLKAARLEIKALKNQPSQADSSSAPLPSGPAVVRTREKGAFSPALKLAALELLVAGVYPSQINATLEASAVFLDSHMEGGLPSTCYFCSAERAI